MAEFLESTGLTMYQIQKALNHEMDTGVPAAHSLDKLIGGGSGLLGMTPGGYPWSCGGMDAVKTWIDTPAVAKALHLNAPGLSKFSCKAVAATLCISVEVAPHAGALTCLALTQSSRTPPHTHTHRPAPRTRSSTLSTFSRHHRPQQRAGFDHPAPGACQENPGIDLQRGLRRVRPIQR